MDINQTIWNFQKSLQTLRLMAGWKQDHLGRMLGLTKQSISNLENSRNRMTKVQYIAIRSIFDHKAAHDDFFSAIYDITIDNDKAWLDKIITEKEEK